MKNNLAVSITLVALVVAAGMLWAVDRAIMSILADVREVRLSGQAEVELNTIDDEIAALIADVNEWADRVNGLKQRQLPTLHDLKSLQRGHKLRLTQMERAESLESASTQETRYTAVLTGTLGSTVRFVQEMETTYILKSTRITVAPATDDGSRVALTLDLALRAE